MSAVWNWAKHKRRVQLRQTVDPSEWSTSLAVRQHVSTTSSFPGVYVALSWLLSGVSVLTLEVMFRVMVQR